MIGQGTNHCSLWRNLLTSLTMLISIFVATVKSTQDSVYYLHMYHVVDEYLLFVNNIGLSYQPVALCSKFDTVNTFLDYS